MPSDLNFYPFACVLFILLCLLLCRFWRCGKATPSARKPPGLKRKPKPFTGLTCKPDCEVCEQGAGSHPQAPGAPPPRMTFARGRHRQVDTSSHFCPYAPCAYQGWVGFGNLRANGHPNGRRWRQLLCLGCNGYFLEATGTPCANTKRACVSSWLSSTPITTSCCLMPACACHCPMPSMGRVQSSGGSCAYPRWPLD
jgi:hypothetical protein